jgi:protein TonB
MRSSWALVLVAMLSVASFPIIAAPTNPAAENKSSPHGFSAQNSTQEQAIPTHAGLALMLRAGCGDVHIFADSADSVKYIVRTGGRAAAFRPGISVLARKTTEGVTLVAAESFARECARWIYEIHVPHRYDLKVSVLSGNIATADIDGSVVLSTGGGDIRAANVGRRDTERERPGGGRFLVRLQTGGGNVYVGNIAGGLRVETAGGQICAGDIEADTVLRTGGGDIHVGHVYGAGHFTTGGGDIVARKIDGGVWADTDGGRVEIGDAARLDSFRTLLPPESPDRFEVAVPVARSNDEPAPLASGFININEFARVLDDFVWGGILVPSADQHRRLLASVTPEYPDVARLAGIDGDVTLRVLGGRDGTVCGITPLSGPGVLVRAAIRAVEQWRYAPALVDGHPVSIVTTVTLAFRLHP